MFDKFKQLNELRKLQQQIKQMTVQGEYNGVKVSLRGDFEMQEITLNSSLDVSTQERAIKTAFNDAKSKMQQMLAKNLGGQLPM